jgi:hypothetical protein
MASYLCPRLPAWAKGSEKRTLAGKNARQCSFFGQPSDRDVTFQNVLAAGMIYSLIIAAIISVWGLLSRKNSVKGEAQTMKTT